MHTQAVSADTLRRTPSEAWSLDVRTMVRPALTYRHLATHAPPGGLLTPLRRPILIAVALGCMASVLATGTATLRLVAPATLYWAYAPIAEALALSLTLLTVGRSRQRVGSSIDAYFAGRGPIVLTVLIVAGTLASVRPDTGWTLLTTVCVGALLVVLVWSVRIDYCFFRDFLGRSRTASLWGVFLLRAIVWPVVFGVFGVPGLTLSGIGAELAGVVREILAG